MLHDLSESEREAKAMPEHAGSLGKDFPLKREVELLGLACLEVMTLP
jgi:hypothetical protein